MKRLFLTFLAFAVVMAFTPMTAHATLTTDLAKITSATTHSSSYNSALKRILSGASGFAVLDDQVITFGDDGNWTLGYDETTDDNLELTTAVSGTDFVIDIAGGNADGEDIVIGAHNMNVSAAGAVIFGQASTISTVTDTALTLRGGDTGTAAGEDVVLLGDNIAFTAGGAGTFGQNTTWTTDAGFTYTIAADDGATEGEDLIFTGNNWRISAAGAMTFFNNAGSIATLAGTALTLTGGDDGGAAGEDVVIDGHNWSMSAAGAMVLPTTSTLDIIDVGGLSINSVATTWTAAESNILTGATGIVAADLTALGGADGNISFATTVMDIPTGFTLDIIDDGVGLVFGGTTLDATVAELNDTDVGNRVSSSLFRTMIGQVRFTVLDAASTTLYLGGMGAAFQVDAISVCASTTLPADAGGVTAVVARVSDSQSVTVAAINLETAVQTADQCTAPAINATPSNVDVGATDYLDVVITTDGTVDTNGTEFVLSVWGSLD